MPTYVDVGAVRVQQFIARWTKLRGRRNASALLAWATSNEAIDPVLALWGGVRLHGEAGDVDGVVSVVLDAGAPTAEVVAGVLLDHLRDTVPGCDLEALWGDGDDYVSAYTNELGPRRAAGDVLVSLPIRREIPVVAACHATEVDPAVTDRKIPGDEEANTRRVGFDVAAQLDLPSDLATRARHQLVVSLGLVDNAQGVAKDPFPETFEALARLGPKKPRDESLGERELKRNHLATVFADGNGMGAFFAKLVKEQSPSKTEVSKACNAAAQAGLKAGLAAAGYKADGSTSPVIPHVVAGDDLLVSVPAYLGIRFVQAYLTEFAAHIRNAVTGIAEEHGDQVLQTMLAEGGLPTASAALVFANQTQPFADIVRLAADRLRSAKELVQGQEASVAWMDVTREGHVPRPGAVAKLADLAIDVETIKATAALPRSLQHRLLLESARTDKMLSDAAVRVVLARDGKSEFAEALTTSRIGAVSILDLARWWA